MKKIQVCTSSYCSPSGKLVRKKLVDSLVNLWHEYRQQVTNAGCITSFITESINHTMASCNVPILYNREWMSTNRACIGYLHDGKEVVFLTVNHTWILYCFTDYMIIKQGIKWQKCECILIHTIQNLNYNKIVFEFEEDTYMEGVLCTNITKKLNMYIFT